MPYIVLIAALAFAASPLLVPGFGGFEPDRYPIPQNDPAVQPAGYAFAIWGLIYLWLVVSAVFGVLKRRTDPAWEAMRAPLALSLAVGAVWLPAAKLGPVLATVLIIVMLVPALMALLRSPARDALWASWPVGLYAGWLSAATCVSIGLLLAGYGVLGEDATAYLMIAVATVLAVVVQVRLMRAPTYGAAVVWAFIGIYVSAPAGVATAALVAIAVVAAVTVWAGLRGWRAAQ